MARSKKAKVETSDEGLDLVCRYYENAAEATVEARNAAERDRDYYDNRQWTAEEESILKKRGQPVIIRNRVKPKIDSLLGLERQGRTDPRANPRTPMDDQAANACTDAIRYVCDEEDFNYKRSEVFENLLIEGSGGAIVEIDDRTDIHVRYIPWDRMFADPHSRARNYRDAKYKGIVVWLDEDEAIAIYGEDARPILEQSWAAYDNTRTYDDKPSYLRWVDGKRKRIKVVEIYYRESGTWMYCHFTKAGYLVKPEKSAYLDEDGSPECPIEYMSCHVDRENQRYGEVRQLIGPQDEINKRASKALHRMTQQQTLAEVGAIEDIQKWKREQAKPDGVMTYNPGMKAEIVKNSDLTAFEMQMLAEAKGEIESIGANEALQGKGPAESGKALNIRRQSGLAETAGPFDSLHQWQRAIYIQIWHRIKQFWTAEKWIRITDDPSNVRFVALNQIGPDGQKINDVSKMDVDIELDDVPDVASAQQEEFTALAEAYKANPQSPVNPSGIPFDLVIETSNLRSKQKILDRLRGGPMPAQSGQMGPDGQPLPASAPPVGVDGQPVPAQPNALAPAMAVPPAEMQPNPADLLNQATQESGMQIQQLAQQIMQGVQQAAQEALQAIQGTAQQIAQGIQQSAAEAIAGIQQAGQQTAEQVQQAGQQAALSVQQASLEAIGGIQNAAGQAASSLNGNAAVAGIQALMASASVAKVVTLPSGRTATIQPVGT